MVAVIGNRAGSAGRAIPLVRTGAGTVRDIVAHSSGVTVAVEGNSANTVASGVGASITDSTSIAIRAASVSLWTCSTTSTSPRSTAHTLTERLGVS